MKRHSALVPLSHHHHHGLVAAERVRAMLNEGLAPKEMERLAEEVRAFHRLDLEPHFKAEERWILPAMEAHAPELVARTQEEHALLRRKARLQGAEDLAAQLADWADALTRHIRFEERELFEATQTMLSEAQMAAIGRELAKLSREPHLPGRPKVP